MCSISSTSELPNGILALLQLATSTLSFNPVLVVAMGVVMLAGTLIAQLVSQGVTVLAVGIIAAAYLAPGLVTDATFLPGETRLRGDYIADAGSVAVISIRSSGSCPAGIISRPSLVTLDAGVHVTP